MLTKDSPICPLCLCPVDTNGIGPSNSPKFSWMLTHVYAKSCSLFHNAGEAHDYRYHIYEYGKDKADAQFEIDMQFAIDNADLNWFSRKWYNYQKGKFHMAVVCGGAKSYEEAQEVCLKQLNLNSRNIR